MQNQSNLEFLRTAGFSLAGPGATSIVIDNRQTGLNNWILTYDQIGAGALQIVLQSAPNVGGVPGTWVTFAGTVITGSNPSTATPSGSICIVGYQPFIRVLSVSQSALIVGLLAGFRTSGTIPASGGTSSAFGSAFPAIGTAIGFEDSSGNMAPVVLTASGQVPVAGSLSITPTTSNTLGQQARVGVGTSVVTLLTANAARKGLWVQNTGLTRIYLGLGFNPTTTNYVVGLPFGGQADDGSSPVWTPSVLWTGTVVAISSAAGGEVVTGEYL
jgi:hypothetical protein